MRQTLWSSGGELIDSLHEFLMTVGGIVKRYLKRGYGLILCARSGGDASD